MKKIIFIALLGILAFVSCQEDLTIVSDSRPKPITKSVGSDSPADTLSYNKVDTIKISKCDALKIVEPIINKYPDTWVDISDEIIPSCTTIAYNDFGVPLEVNDMSYIVSPDYDSWLIALGFDHSFLGRQEIIHLFVNSQTGEYKELSLIGRAIVKWDYSRYIHEYPNKTVGPNNSKNATPTIRSYEPNKWAVIISGGGDVSINYKCFWYDVCSIYNQLISVGFSKSNIYCLVSDGNDTAIDRRVSSYMFDNSPTDFDEDNYSDVDYPAKEEWISEVFDTIGSLAQPGDELLVFMTGHGSYNGVTLWGTDVLSPTELNSELNKLDPGVLVDVVMGESYSGSFISTLANTNRTIAAACLSTETVAAEIYLCTHFLFGWTVNIGYYYNYSDDLYVTPYELFLSANAYTDTFINTPTHPQYSSTPTDFGSKHSIDSGMIPVITGNNSISLNANTAYSISYLPPLASTTWTVGNNMTLVSYSDSTVTVRGDFWDPYNFVSSGTTLSATISVSGKDHEITRAIDAVWKPGQYMNFNLIQGGGGFYSIGEGYNLSGAYGYYWECTNPNWQITYQDENHVYITEGNTSDPVYLMVTLNDPYGGSVFVFDQVYP